MLTALTYMARGDCRARSKALDLGSSLEGVQGFESLPPHYRFVQALSPDVNRASTLAPYPSHCPIGVGSGSRLCQAFLNPGLDDQPDLPTGEALLPGDALEVGLEPPEDLEDDRIDLDRIDCICPRAISIVL